MCFPHTHFHQFNYSAITTANSRDINSAPRCSRRQVDDSIMHHKCNQTNRVRTWNSLRCSSERAHRKHSPNIADGPVATECAEIICDKWSIIDCIYFEGYRERECAVESEGCYEYNIRIYCVAIPVPAAFRWTAACLASNVLRTAMSYCSRSALHGPIIEGARSPQTGVLYE